MNAPPMSFMREKVETQYKPALEMLRAGLVPHGRLIAGGLEMTIAHYEETFRAMDERHGDELPEFRGDFTPYWEDGAGSSSRRAPHRSSAPQHCL